jgi:hypothetical protein
MLQSFDVEQIPLLTRREIEARIVGPLLERFAEELGRETVLKLTQQVISKIAHEQGKQLADIFGGRTLGHFVKCLEMWKLGDALEIELLEQTEHRLSFNVTHCRYAEMCKELGIESLGITMSCSRDFALVEGFNPDIILTRNQTIMEGARFCDFRLDSKPGE